MIGAIGFPAIVVEAGILAGVLIAGGGALYATGAIVYAAQRPTRARRCSATTRSSTCS